MWTIPAERVKNRITHVVPLAPLALELIEEARTIAMEDERKRAEKSPGSESHEPKWLFPSSRGNRSIKPKAVNLALRRCLKGTKEDIGPTINLEYLTPHDLRRTAATGMTALGINRLVVSKILNHVETGVTAVYDRHSYDAEKRHALEVWASHLEGIVSGKSTASNVVTLATAGEAQ
jgi:integrase